MPYQQENFGGIYCWVLPWDDMIRFNLQSLTVWLETLLIQSCCCGLVIIRHEFQVGVRYDQIIEFPESCHSVHCLLHRGLLEVAILQEDRTQPANSTTSEYAASDTISVVIHGVPASLPSPLIALFRILHSSLDELTTLTK